MVLFSFAWGQVFKDLKDLKDLRDLKDFKGLTGPSRQQILPNSANFVQKYDILLIHSTKQPTFQQKCTVFVIMQQIIRTFAPQITTKTPPT